MHPRSDVDLTFPVLCLSQDGSIAPAENADALHRCNALAFFTNRYYQGMVVIDARARHFRVVRADVVPALSPVKRRMARFFNKPLTVTLEFDVAGPASLDAAKALIAEWLDRAPSFWEASRDLEEWKAMVAQAGSARALIALFS